MSTCNQLVGFGITRVLTDWLCPKQKLPGQCVKGKKERKKEECFTHCFRGIYRIYLRWKKQNRKMSTCNCRLTVVSLGSWPTDYAQNKNFLGSERRKKNGSPIVLEESMEYTSDEKKSQTGRCEHVTNPVGFRITSILTDWLCPKQKPLKHYDRGEPAVSYRWTGRVWEITG